MLEGDAVGARHERRPRPPRADHHPAREAGLQVLAAQGHQAMGPLDPGVRDAGVPHTFRWRDSADAPARTSDFVHIRYVVIHLPDPEKAVARLASRLGPRGVLLLEEPSFRRRRTDLPSAAERLEAR
ncbi:methyltransferase domain-containing protein [Streptomyces sp. NPDC021224]|uniref:methyltransferase domain-containing protein n=1 Tax=unclassified Streptomyces TaxID=2593676 RepID=UPI0037928229